METAVRKHTPGACAARLNAVGDTLYAISGKWKLRLVVALMDGDLRFNELQRSVKGISAKMLSKELKEMELNRFVIKLQGEAGQQAGSYQLTPYSASLFTVINTLHDWGIQHKKMVTGKIGTVQE
jgi:DNA-binding HxlR family transcriptional regulator